MRGERRSGSRFLVWWVEFPPSAPSAPYPHEDEILASVGGRCERWEELRFQYAYGLEQIPPCMIYGYRFYDHFAGVCPVAASCICLALSMCHLSRRFPLVDLGAGRSLILRDSQGHSVVPCRHVAAKPAPRGPLPPAGCFKSIKKARILQIYAQITGLKCCIFANKYLFLEHKGTTAGKSPEPGRPLERLHGFPVLCIFSSRKPAT